MIDIKHIETASEGVFRAWSEETQVGEMTYLRQGETMTINHTRVFDGFEGQGIARQLVLAAVAFARAHGRKIIPICSYAQAFFARNEEYQDVIGDR